eukprot:TRINITY_DN21611_c0_g1_i1.p1 TRINITY_DN21611_c0_g1~~TRINITY_DN21611_c0_g1_i1.p1  ORF type:complete len:310 (+),score=18.95 TRINITY_DN21611_c0_g1_i1:118-1047(+)
MRCLRAQYLHRYGVSVQLPAFKVSLTGNRLHPKASMAIGRALATSTLLARLHLPGNSLGKEGIAVIAANVRSCPSLTSLDLSDNDAGPEGAQALCRLLWPDDSGCNALQCLGFARNAIGDSGFRSFCDSGAGPLDILALGCNAISLQPGTPWDRLLPRLRCQVLLMPENEITPDGRRALVRAAVEGGGRQLARIEVCNETIGGDCGVLLSGLGYWGFGNPKTSSEYATEDALLSDIHVVLVHHDQQITSCAGRSQESEVDSLLTEFNVLCQVAALCNVCLGREVTKIPPLLGEESAALVVAELRRLTAH